ncbi:odorant receptor 131-2-like [Gadus macrocephalus]|uniref:odorant receptor 131-2-like n=1 Tax=Gadus macrocephalus TaxID=80720 RepID=UPI0028CB88ED|nr:odorant receptor 131-2-like [Gadus macrocephalus]XP_059912063.1 odorant receptor 131-2-like [Gadus macrocephalus]
MPNDFQLQQNSSTSNGSTENKAGVNVVVSFIPCVIFLYINCVMLYTLRSKPVFRETSRYLLLYNLLLAETLQMALAQMMFLIAVGMVLMTRLVCLLVFIPTIITTVISPFNLALMSLDTYVAVCFPLRHASIVTVPTTYGAIALMWAISLANMLVRVIMLKFLDARPFGQFMSMLCTETNIFQLKIFSEFESGFVCAQFVSVGLIIILSYVGVMVAAKAASIDKVSANKASKTVLLHMIQMGLSLSSTFVNMILTGLHGKVDVITFRHLRFSLFVCLINLPRCLSCLIYGLRDNMIRPILIRHLRLGINFKIYNFHTHDVNR